MWKPLAALLLLGAANLATAGNWQGRIDLEGRHFFLPGLYSGQARGEASVALQAETFHDLDDAWRLTFEGYLRQDSQDRRRNLRDIRELALTWVGDGIELRAGLDKVFWGVTESVHLVDIINQTDMTESPDGEAKLGQPMLKLAFEGDWGNLDLFVLPGFRERRFPGPQGRLRTPVAIAAKAVYEAGDGNRHVDYALRYSHSLDDWDLGLSVFSGTSREPGFIPVFNGTGELTALAPYYEQIVQYGLDAQYIHDAWLWKVEAIQRQGQGAKTFNALAAGLEYTLYGLFDGPTDLGIVAEWLWDERGDQATTPMNHDLMLGLRWVGNDVDGTEALFGLVQDIRNGGRLISLEASRRLGSRWKTSLEIRLFDAIAPADFIYVSRRDSFARLVLTRYF